jgi:hypothetical protein
MTSSTPTKTQRLLQRLYVLHHTYYYLMGSSLPSTDPISGHFWPFHTIVYSSEHESNEIMDPTMSSNTPIKTPNLLQRLYVLNHTYYYMMESSLHVYRPNISPLLAISYYIILF